MLGIKNFLPRQYGKQSNEDTTPISVLSSLSNRLSIENKIKAFEYIHEPNYLDQINPFEVEQKTNLRGCGVGVKDIFCTNDMPTNYGINRHNNEVYKSDATIVSRLRKAGAILVGKTVTTECAYGASGKTRNPHDLSRTPGGSSSGSAAAVAAGLVPLALGSQTSGSIIRPAGYCGIWGIKPSYGILPRTGMASLSPSFDHPGYFSNSLVLLARAIDISSGDDFKDKATLKQHQTQLEAKLNEPESPLTFGFLKTDSWPLLDEVSKTQILQLVNLLEASEIKLPFSFLELRNIHNLILSFEASRSLYELYISGPKGYSKKLRDRIKEGLNISEIEYLEAKKTLNKLKPKLDLILSKFDGIVSPGTIGEAPLGLSFTGSREPTILWSTFGNPAINIPLIEGSNGLPMGLQLTGAVKNDEKLMKSALWVHKAWEHENIN